MLGPVVSLNGSPTVSPTTAALWTSLPLPPSCPSSMYFLALSHAPPAFAIIKPVTTPMPSAPCEESPQRFCAQQEAYRQRRNHRNRAGQNHLAQRCAGYDVDTAVIIGLAFAFQQAEFAELAAHLFHHLVGGAADRFKRERREEARHRDTNKHANQRLWVHEVNRLQSRLALVRSEERQRGERRAADGEAFANRGGRVAQRDRVYR